MNYHYFYGIALAALLFVSMTAEDCGEYMSSVVGAAAQNDLQKNPDKGVQAAGASGQAITDWNSYVDAQRRALSSNNLRKGENMDFTDIDNLVKAKPYEDGFYLQRAAMLVAAGKSEAMVAQNTGQALAIIKNANSSGQEKQAVYRYMGELGHVQTGLVKGTPAWNRVHNELCAQQNLYKTSFKPDSLYSEYTETLINAALADGPC